MLRHTVRMTVISSVRSITRVRNRGVAQKEADPLAEETMVGEVEMTETGTLEMIVVPTETRGQLDVQVVLEALAAEVTARTAEAVQAVAWVVNLGQIFSRELTWHQKMMLRQSC